MAPGIVLKVGPRERRKIWRNRLPGKQKEENESVGLSHNRKMRFAWSLHRTQLFCNGQHARTEQDIATWAEFSWRGPPQGWNQEVGIDLQQQRLPELAGREQPNGKVPRQVWNLPDCL